MSLFHTRSTDEIKVLPDNRTKDPDTSPLARGSTVISVFKQGDLLFLLTPDGGCISLETPPFWELDNPDLISAQMQHEIANEGAALILSGRRYVFHVSQDGTTGKWVEENIALKTKPVVLEN